VKRSAELLKSPLALNFPLHVCFFQKIRLRSDLTDQLVKSSSSICVRHLTSPQAPTIESSITVEKPSQIFPLLCIIQEILTRTVAPPLLSEWFLQDHVRRIADNARTILLTVLSPACPVSTSFRCALSTNLLKCASIFGPNRDAIHLQIMLLKHRLVEGPMLGWETADTYLTNCFEIGISKPSSAEFVEILSILRSRSWGDEGADLRVSTSQVKHMIETKAYHRWQGENFFECAWHM
jgi:hypothetical protein